MLGEGVQGGTKPREGISRAGAGTGWQDAGEPQTKLLWDHQDWRRQSVTVPKLHLPGSDTQAGKLSENRAEKER